MVGFMSTGCEKDDILTDIDPLAKDTIQVNDTMTLITNPSSIPYPEGDYFQNVQNTDTKDTTWSVMVKELTVGKGSATEVIYMDGNLTATDNFTLGACYQIPESNIYAFELKYQGNRTNTYLVYRTGDEFIARASGTVAEVAHEISSYSDFLQYCEIYNRK